MVTTAPPDGEIFFKLPYSAPTKSVNPCPMSLSNPQKKQMRQLGHALKPVVTVADKGLSESVRNELERALNDHELIKVKIRAEEREDKAALIKAICEECRAELVQSIGHIILIYRQADKQNPKLSNLLRSQ